MDPLSVTVGIAGLLSLAIQLVEIGTKYGDSPKTQGYDFIFELRALIDVLTRLKVFLEGPDAPPTFNHMSVFIATNTRCKAKLQGILWKLEKSHAETSKIKRIRDQILWPLAEKEHRETIEDIHRYTEIFNFALSVEGCMLLAKSSSETAAALDAQAQKIEETRTLCGALPELVTHLETSLDHISTIRRLTEEIPTLAHGLFSISEGISDLKVAVATQSRQHDEADRKELLSWLSPMSFEARQRQLFGIHQRGTGEWLLQHELFQQWKSVKGSRMWCTGIPGAGKTIMASLIIDSLQSAELSPTTPLAFLYADYKERHQQTSVNLISGIVRQLAMQIPGIMESAILMRRDIAAQTWDKQAPRLNFSQNLELLKQGTKHASRIYIVIDAVDEMCGPEEMDEHDVRSEVLHAISQLECASILCTSRPHIDANLYFPESLNITVEAKNEDLRTFLDKTLSTSRRLQGFFSRDASLKNDIITTICMKASGMFLMARFQAEEVKMALSIRQVRVILETLSRKLFEMYQRTLERIRSQPENEANIGTRAISWVANVKRPLTVSEFVHAMSVQKEDKNLDDDSLIDFTTILEACGGLLQQQRGVQEYESLNNPFNDEATVGFVHYTMQEFMDKTDTHTASNSDIANTSLTYLCFNVFRTKPTVASYNPCKTWPFLAYAAPFWPGHAEGANADLRKDLIEALISPSFTNLSQNWLRFAFTRQPGNIPVGFAAAAVSIQKARNILQLMLDFGLGPSINVQHFGALTPFSVALSLGPRDCLDLLYVGGLSSSRKSNRFWTIAALRHCHQLHAMDLFISLLESNLKTIMVADQADFTAQEFSSMPYRKDRSLLGEAIRLGETQLVKFLIAAGWNVNVSYDMGQQWSVVEHTTPLCDAVSCQSDELIQILIDSGSSILTTEKGRSPLRIAVDLCDASNVSLFLAAGARVHHDTWKNDTPLTAAMRSCPHMVQMLLESMDSSESSNDPDPMNLALELWTEYGYQVLIGLVARHFPRDLSKQPYSLHFYRIISSSRFSLGRILIEAQSATTDPTWLLHIQQLLSDAQNHICLTQSLTGDMVYHTASPSTELLAILRDCLAQEVSQPHLIGTVSSLVIRCDNLSLVQWSLRHMNSSDPSFERVTSKILMQAFKYRKLAIVEYLLEKGARATSFSDRLFLEIYIFCAGHNTIVDKSTKTWILHYAHLWNFSDNAGQFVNPERLLFLSRKTGKSLNSFLKHVLSEDSFLSSPWIRTIARWKDDYQSKVTGSSVALARLMERALEGNLPTDPTCKGATALCFRSLHEITNPWFYQVDDFLRNITDVGPGSKLG